MSYNIMRKIFTHLILAGFLASSPAAMAFSLLEWLGFGNDQEETEPNPDPDQTGTANWAEASGEQTVAEQPVTQTPVRREAVNFDEIKLIIANLNPDQRRQLLSDETAFNNFVQQQVINESVLTAARANRLEEEPLTRLLMEKSAENALREIYIKRLINKELPANFPDEEQTRTFYDNNQDRFTLEERVHVWQIFLPFGQDADAKTREAVKKQAEDLRKKIESQKLGFSAAATEHSQHIPSRHAGGYMGLIKLSDIKPEIKESVLNLKENELSQPVLTDDGYHLIKRGTRINASVLPYDQVKARIKQLLRKEAENRLRSAIFEQANKTYGQALHSNRIEEWRLKLRTNL
ncbi:MAG: peptidylprolyl isomerase [Gammaproteobacteria bacterium]|nr:peptidylprolyl isomerase [Gammaproteobacteria bacterium]